MSGPRVFGLPHLSEDAVTACADGVLSAAAMSRARRHCAECAECADAVRGQREAAMLLRAAQAPALPSGLLARLTGLPMSASLPPSRGGLPTVLDADGTAMFVAYDMRRADPPHRIDRELAGPTGAEPGEADQDSAGASRSRDTGHRDTGSHTGQPEPHGRQPHRRGVLPVTVLASAAAVVAAGTLGSHVSTLAADSPAPAGAASVAGSLADVRNVAVVAPGPLLATGSPAGDRTLFVAGPAAPTSVTVAPVRRAVWQSQAAAGRLPAGLPPMPIGLPAATP